MRLPENLPLHEERGEFRILVKKDNCLTEVILDHHPFDVVGWDGYYYPWALNIEDFEPRVGRFHLPPPTIIQTMWLYCALRDNAPGASRKE